MPRNTPVEETEILDEQAPEGAENEAAAEEEEGEDEGGIIDVKAGTGSGADRVEVSMPFNAGANLDEAVAMYGENVVFTRYVRQVTREFGVAIRTELGKENATPESVLANQSLINWRPDTTRRTKRDKAQTIEEQFAALTPEQQAALIEKLMAKATGTPEPIAE